MNIGELAKRAGVNIQSIRFYEREHVLPEPVRAPSGYRKYTERDLEAVVFVKQCQYLGFTLQEISELADLHRSVALIRDADNLPAREMERIMAIAAERLKTIDEKISQLQQLRERMVAGTSALARGRCPARRTSNQK